MTDATKSAALQEPLWTQPFILLSLSNFFVFLGFQMLLPTVPLFVSEHGGSSTQVGLVIGLLTLSAVLIRPFAGASLDKWGRKLILAVGILICLLAMGGYLIAATVFLVLMIRFVHGIGWGIATTTFGVMASDVIPASRRGEGMGYFGLGSTLAMAAGPFAGLWLLNEFGFTALFAATLISTLVALIGMQFIKMPSRDKGTAPAASVSFWSRIVDRSALFPSFLALLLGGTYGGLVSFITLFGKEAGIANIGWFFLFNAASVFVIRPIAGKLFDRKGHVWVLFPGALFSIAGLILISYANSTWSLIAAAILYGIGFGAIQPSIQAWVIGRAAPNRRGAANATFYSAFDLGIGGGGMLLGMVAQATSYAVMYRYSALILVAYLICYFFYMSSSGRRSGGKPVSQQP